MRRALVVAALLVACRAEPKLAATRDDPPKPSPSIVHSASAIPAPVPSPPIAPSPIVERDIVVGSASEKAVVHASIPADFEDLGSRFEAPADSSDAG